MTLATRGVNHNRSAATADDSMANQPVTSAVIECLGCGKPSPCDRKFCSSCGKSLWDSCMKCQAPRPASDRFCGACGADTQEVENKAVAETQHLLDQAQASHSRGEFADAQRLLWMAGKVTTPAARSLAAEARRLQAEFQAEEARQRLVRDETIAAARQLLQSNRFADAEAKLASIPGPLQNDEIRDLLATARARREEIARLTAEIKAGLEAQRYAEVLPRAERLLVLQPQNEQVKKIQSQLGRKILEQAIARLQKQQYPAALDLLHQVPESSRDEAYTKAYEQASEMVWLTGAVKTLPFADHFLKGVLDRLARLMPGDEGVKKLQDRFEQVSSAAAKNGERLGPPGWAKPPEATPFAAPIEATFGFRRLKFEAEGVRAGLKENPAQFYVAAGLALQGLGRAAVNANLLAAAEQQGFFSGFSNLLGESSGAMVAWGLDCSAAGLKVVELRGKPGNDEIEVGTCLLLRPDLTNAKPASDDEQRRIRERLVKAFIEKCQPKPSDRIGVSLSGSKVLGRFVELPPIPGDKLQEIIRYESTHQIPIPLDQVHWTFHVLGDRSSAQAAAGPTQVMFLAAKNYHVADARSLFQDAGLRIDILQSDCVALHNWFVYDRLPAAADAKPETILLLDIGSDATNFVVTSRNEVWFRSAPQGGNDFSSALVRHLQLTLDQAERLKRNPALGRRISPAFDAVGPLLDTLVKETERAINSYAAYRRGAKIDRIIGLGGGFQMPGLLRHLRLAKAE